MNSKLVLNLVNEMQQIFWCLKRRGKNYNECQSRTENLVSGASGRMSVVFV